MPHNIYDSLCRKCGCTGLFGDVERLRVRVHPFAGLPVTIPTGLLSDAIQRPPLPTLLRGQGWGDEGVPGLECSHRVCHCNFRQNSISASLQRALHFDCTVKVTEFVQNHSIGVTHLSLARTKTFDFTIVSTHGLVLGLTNIFVICKYLHSVHIPICVIISHPASPLSRSIETIQKLFNGVPISCLMICIR